MIKIRIKELTTKKTRNKKIYSHKIEILLVTNESRTTWRQEDCTKFKKHVKGRVQNGDWEENLINLW